MTFNFPAEKKYFLVPEMPTPNGRMHLGHIAGPYLKMDVLKRKVERGNGEAYLYSGSDVYESYVELKASQLNLPTDTICNHFHKLILNDFKALNINFDFFINPLDDTWFKDFTAFHKVLAQNLADSKMLVEKDETFLYDKKNERYINGCWAKGICPNCKKQTGSYLCENCGTHYRPQDIINLKDYPDAEIVEGKSVYLKLDTQKIFEHLDKMRIEPFKKILERYIELQGPFVRLTTPQKTGVNWSWNNISNQVLYTYTSLLFFSIYCGRIFQCQHHLKPNPFDVDSDFITIASFGIDNAIPYLGGVLGGGIALANYKPFDYYLYNYFYDLNNQKFSTSRVHVIWGSDIVEISNIQSDAVRYYLCMINPEFEKKNFDVNQFIHTINKNLIETVNHFVIDAFNRIEVNKNYQIDATLLDKINYAIVNQNKYITLPNFNLSQFAHSINEWIFNYKDLDETAKFQYAYWWLKTFTYLSYPILPEFSSKMWKNFSTTDKINNNTFFETNALLSSNIDGLLFNKVDYNQLKLSLPETILNLI